MSNIRSNLTAAPRSIQSYVNGHFRDRTTSVIEITDPFSEQTIALLDESDAAEVDRAVSAARRAFDHGPWPRSTVAERQRILIAIHDIIVANADELAILEAINTGIPLAQTRHIHILRAAANFKFFAEYIGQRGGEVYEQEPGILSTVVREPLGVCGLIGPWNMPLGLTSMKIAAALAFGNTCVVKPSEMTPLTVTRVFELIEGVGLPPGVLNLVNGRGQVTGAALSNHPGIDMISFTGGTETGATIMAALAKGIKRSAMELGGKSASIVYDDADLDRAIDGTVLGSFMNNGQMCLAGSRIFVQRSIADSFIDKYVARVKNLSLGDPLAQGVEIGPMINAAQRERVLRYAAQGQDQGAELLAGGGAPTSANAGYFVEPTVMLAPDNSLGICQDEIFGPFATLQLFDDQDEVIARANDSQFGLVGYVWSQSMQRAHTTAHALRTGSVMVNTPIVRDLRTGFGGYKQSGLGREGARGSEVMFTEMKSILMARTDTPILRLGA